MSLGLALVRRELAVNNPLVRKPGIYDPETIFALVRKSPVKQVVLDGDDVKICSVRLRVFAYKGCQCVSCGVVGTRVYKERGVDQIRWHLNLYAVVDGKEILMTKDHTVPKCLGGSNALSNLQPMCAKCNFAKGAKYDSLG